MSTHTHSYFEPPLQSNAVLIECQEHPRPFLSVKQAALRAGVPHSTFVTAVKRHAWNHGPKSYARIGELHFRRVPREEIPEAGEEPRPQPAQWKPLNGAALSPAPTTTPAPLSTAIGETRPRRRGDLSPINPHIIGALAPIRHQERPT